MMKDGGSRVTASVETRPSASDRRGGHLRLYAFAGAPAVKCNGWYKSIAEDDDADATLEAWQSWGQCTCVGCSHTWRCIGSTLSHGKAAGVLAESQSHSLRPRIHIATAAIASLLPHKEPKCQLRAGHAAASIAWLPLWSGGCSKTPQLGTGHWAFANWQFAKINRVCFAVC